MKGVKEFAKKLDMYTKRVLKRSKTYQSENRNHFGRAIFYAVFKHCDWLSLVLASLVLASHALLS